MAAFKIVFGLKQGKCVQKELPEANAKVLIGKQIGDKIAGDTIGFEGYEFQITGGSDYCGFPMRKDIPGANRKRIFAVEGIGLHKKKKGIRVRKTVAGNTIHTKTAQINLKMIKEGNKPLIEDKKEETPKTEEAPAQ